MLSRHVVVLFVALLVSPLVAVGPGVAQAAAVSPVEVAAREYAAMTPAERVGQLFMVGMPVTGATSTEKATLRRHHVGNVIVMGRSLAGTAEVARAVSPVRQATTLGAVRPFVAVDQEGGLVQHLTGPGFSAMPTALRQGALSGGALVADARIWAGQLLRAGINVDLAPVADVVPASIGSRNLVIGNRFREYGHTPAVVGSHVADVVRGMHAAGVATAVKHFPGLGRASGNTDTTREVTDPTRRHDPYLASFAAGINAGAPFVMMSTATYPNLDPRNKAVFSATVISTVLRGDLGFRGVVISDSLLSASMAGINPAQRALRFLRAGGDMLLVTDDSTLSTMTAAVLTELRADPRFAATVNTAVTTVLAAKARAGLIS